MGRTKTKKRSIMVIDDHPIIHDGLKILLNAEPDLRISASARSATQALELLAEELPDIAIIDLSLCDSDGTYLIQKVHSRYPHLHILVYTMSEEKLFASRTAMAGASGYVMKTAPGEELKLAIRTVLDGRLYFEAPVIKKIENARNGRGSGMPHTAMDTLSNREMDIFKLLGEGLDTVSIGKKLKISRNTVDTHRINIKNKLELGSSKELEHLAFQVIREGRLPEGT